MPNGGGSACWLLLCARTVVLVVLVLGGASVAWPAGAATGDDAAVAADVERAFTQRLVEERRAHGLGGLDPADELVAVARRHSTRMAGETRVFHNARLPDEVAGWQTLGENVGRGPTVEELHASFMASAVHRAEILRPEFSGVGVGVVRTGDTLWVTQVFREPLATRTTAAPRTRPPATASGAAVRPGRPARTPGTTAPSTSTTAPSTSTSTTTTSTATTVPPPPVSRRAALAAGPLGSPGAVPTVPPGPAVPAAGALAAGLLWAVVAGATGVTAGQRPVPRLG